MKKLFSSVGIALVAMLIVVGVVFACNPKEIIVTAGTPTCSGWSASETHGSDITGIVWHPAKTGVWGTSPVSVYATGNYTESVCTRWNPQGKCTKYEDVVKTATSNTVIITKPNCYVPPTPISDRDCFVWSATYGTDSKTGSWSLGQDTVVFTLIDVTKLGTSSHEFTITRPNAQKCYSEPKPVESNTCSNWSVNYGSDKASGNWSEGNTTASGTLTDVDAWGASSSYPYSFTRDSSCLVEPSYTENSDCIEWSVRFGDTILGKSWTPTYTTDSGVIWWTDTYGFTFSKPYSLSRPDKSTCDAVNPQEPFWGENCNGWWTGVDGNKTDGGSWSPEVTSHEAVVINYTDDYGKKLSVTTDSFARDNKKCANPVEEDISYKAGCKSWFLLPATLPEGITAEYSQTSGKMDWSKKQIVVTAVYKDPYGVTVGNAEVTVKKPNYNKCFPDNVEVCVVCGPHQAEAPKAGYAGFVMYYNPGLLKPKFNDLNNFRAIMVSKNQFDGSTLMSDGWYVADVKSSVAKTFRWTAPNDWYPYEVCSCEMGAWFVGVDGTVAKRPCLNSSDVTSYLMNVKKMNYSDAKAWVDDWYSTGVKALP